MESRGFCGVEKASIYGAALAIPQIARSVGWSTTLTGLTIRSYIFLTLNIFLQGFLILMIGESAHVMNPFGGQMHLCDFGASIPECPHAKNCLGPGGTILSYPRLYGWDIWNTRAFARDGLSAVFPNRTKEIHTALDPGEYGLENWYAAVGVRLPLHDGGGGRPPRHGG